MSQGKQISKANGVFFHSNCSCYFFRSVH